MLTAKDIQVLNYVLRLGYEEYLEVDSSVLVEGKIIVKCYDNNPQEAEQIYNFYQFLANNANNECIPFIGFYIFTFDFLEVIVKE